MKALLAASCLASAVLFGGSVLACEGKNVVFEDTFQDDSGGWDPSENLTFGPASLTIDVGAEFTNLKEMNSAFAVKDADICADVAFPKKIDSVPYAGLIFWAVDYTNFFLFQVSQAGTASLWRMNNGKWLEIYSGKAPSLKTDPGATNRLRATVKGNTVTVYVNGEKVRAQKAQAPQGDSLFGLYVQLDAAVADADGRTFAVTSYKVTDAP